MDWLKIGIEASLAEAEPTTLSVLGKAIRVWRDDDGSWRAMEMHCRHQNQDLTHAERDGDIVTCPRHGWRYDLSTGACLTEGWAGLRRFDTKTEDGALFVSLRPVES